MFGNSTVLGGRSCIVKPLLALLWLCTYHDLGRPPVLQTTPSSSCVRVGCCHDLPQTAPSQQWHDIRTAATCAGPCKVNGVATASMDMGDFLYYTLVKSSWLYFNAALQVCVAAPSTASRPMRRAT